MLNRISTVNPESLMPRAPQPIQGNPIIDGYRANEDRIRMREEEARKRQMEDEDRARQSQEFQWKQEDRGFQQQDRQVKAIMDMAQNPQMASQIAQQYGVPFTPDLQKIISDRDLTARTVEGLTLMKQMGIENPQAMSVGMKAYTQTRNPDAIAQAIQGMDTRAPMSRAQEAQLAESRRRTAIDERRANAYIDNMRSGGGRNYQVGFNATDDIRDAIDRHFGVVWADEDRTKLAEGSQSPIDPSTLSALELAASQIYAETGNATMALQGAIQLMGGEGALYDMGDSPYVKDSGWFGLGGENYPYRGIPTAPQGKFNQEPKFTPKDTAPIPPNSPPMNMSELPPPNQTPIPSNNSSKQSQYRALWE